MSPHKVLFVGRGRIRLPLSPDLARKWDAVGEQLDYRILGAAEDGKSELVSSDFDSRLHSVLTGSTGSVSSCSRCGFEISYESSAPTPSWLPTCSWAPRSWPGGDSCARACP